MAITNSALPFVIERATTAWPGNMNEKDFVPQIDTLLAIRDQQTAQLQLANLPEGVDAKITWMNNCDLGVDTYTAECTFSGQEADTYKKDLTIDQDGQTTFTVPIDGWDDNVFKYADATATNLLKTMVVQAEEVAQYAVGVLNANLGESEYTTNPSWTVSGTETLVPGSEWESTAIIGKLMIAGKKNRIINPILLSGENLAQLAFMSRTSAANGEGKGDFARISQMPIYNDIFNVDDVNAGSLLTYMIERGSLAFLSKGYFSTTPEVMDGNTRRFSVQNRFFPQLWHDVIVYRSCASGVWKENWKIRPRYKLEINPTGCTATRTGILAFTNSGI